MTVDGDDLESTTAVPSTVADTGSDLAVSTDADLEVVTTSSPEVEQTEIVTDVSSDVEDVELTTSASDIVGEPSEAEITESPEAEVTDESVTLPPSTGETESPIIDDEDLTPVTSISLPEKEELDETTTISSELDATVISTEAPIESMLSASTDIPESEDTELDTQGVSDESETESTTPQDSNLEEVEATTGEPGVSEDKELDSTVSPDVDGTETVSSVDTNLGEETTESSEAEDTKLPSTLAPSGDALVTEIPLTIDGSCYKSGNVYENGAEVPPSSNCSEKCVCTEGEIMCTTVTCPNAKPPAFLNCEVTTSPDECCPTYLCGRFSKMRKVLHFSHFNNDILVTFLNLQ